MARPSSLLAALVLLGCSLAIGCPALACDVPVFRYALELWPSADYEVFVLQRDPLSASEQNAAEYLSASTGELSPHVNIKVRVADLAHASGAPLAELWEEAGRPDLPCLILRYPRESGIDRIAWSGPLTTESVWALVDSPARREISRRILAGHSAVWVLLTSGDADKDAAAEALLDRCLSKIEQTLELPAPVAGTLAGQTSMPEAEAPPLQIRFSFLSISPRDPAESVLAGMLLRSEPDLSDYAAKLKLIAFPVYGRGRALYALAGRGLNEENISEACQFLAGPCFCEAKALAPGTDLVVATDWDTALEGSPRQAVVEQPLVGLSTLAEAGSDPGASGQNLDVAAVESPPSLEELSPGLEGAANAREASAPVSEAVGGPAPSASDSPARAAPLPLGKLFRNLLIAFGALLVVILFLGIYISKKAARQRL